MYGEGGIYDNHAAGYAISGPRNCPKVPSGCTDTPHLGEFPAANQDLSEAAFESRRQPFNLECWPRNKTDVDGYSNNSIMPCDDTIHVLEDVKYGWPAKCDQNSMHKQELTPGQTAWNVATCYQRCVRQPLCSAWVLQSSTAAHGADCYTGEGRFCFQKVSFPDVVAGQRIMHGDVRVLTDKLKNSQIFGLTHMFDQNYFVDQEPDATNACRMACYSNLECQYWQYFKTSGCWIEAPMAGEKSRVGYPATYADWSSETPQALNAIAGEYVQHACPGHVHIPKNFSLFYSPPAGLWTKGADHYDTLQNDRLKYPQVKPAPKQGSVTATSHTYSPLATPPPLAVLPQAGASQAWSSGMPPIQAARAGASSLSAILVTLGASGLAVSAAIALVRHHRSHQFVAATGHVVVQGDEEEATLADSLVVE